MTVDEFRAIPIGSRIYDARHGRRVFVGHLMRVGRVPDDVDAVALAELHLPNFDYLVPVANIAPYATVDEERRERDDEIETPFRESGDYEYDLEDDEDGEYEDDEVCEAGCGVCGNRCYVKHGDDECTVDTHRCADHPSTPVDAAFPGATWVQTPMGQVAQVFAATRYTWSDGRFSIDPSDRLEELRTRRLCDGLEQTWLRVDLFRMGILRPPPLRVGMYVQDGCGVGRVTYFAIVDDMPVAQFIDNDGMSRMRVPDPAFRTISAPPQDVRMRMRITGREGSAPSDATVEARTLRLNAGDHITASNLQRLYGGSERLRSFLHLRSLDVALRVQGPHDLPADNPAVYTIVQVDWTKDVRTDVVEAPYRVGDLVRSDTGQTIGTAVPPPPSTFIGCYTDASDACRLDSIDSRPAVELTPGSGTSLSTFARMYENAVEREREISDTNLGLVALRRQLESRDLTETLAIAAEVAAAQSFADAVQTLCARLDPLDEAAARLARKRNELEALKRELAVAVDAREAREAREIRVAQERARREELAPILGCALCGPTCTCTPRTSTSTASVATTDTILT